MGVTLAYTGRLARLLNWKVLQRQRLRLAWRLVCHLLGLANLLGFLLPPVLEVSVMSFLKAVEM